MPTHSVDRGTRAKLARGPGVARLMSTPVLSVTRGMLAHDALALAVQHRIHHLPVVDRETALGMVCTCDLEDAKPSDSVGSAMRSPTQYVSPLSSDHEALQLMNQHRVGSLLVVEDGRILGIITRGDLKHAGTPMFEDPRGFCSCCGAISHLREHATGALCAECLGRSHSDSGVDHGGEG